MRPCAVLVIDIATGDRTNILDQAICRQILKGRAINLSAFGIKLAGQDAPAAQRGKRVVEPANSREQVNESEGPCDHGRMLWLHAVKSMVPSGTSFRH
jgi:hypothetical protein